MSSIFIGFIFIFLQININIGASIIGLMPAFIGYIFILSGIKQLSSESERYGKIRALTLVMCIYTAVAYAMDIFGLSAQLGWFSVILGLLSTAASLYISYNIVLGVFDIEEKRMTDLNGRALKTKWAMLAVSQVIFNLSVLIPVLMIIAGIVMVIFLILFLIEFSKTKNLYNSLPPYENSTNQDIEF